MTKTEKIYYRITARVGLEFEMWFYPVLFWGLSISAIITVLLSINAWGLLYASVIVFSATICAVAFWKVQSHFVRSFRSSVLLCLLMLVGFSFCILVGSFTPQGHGISIYLLIEPIGIGVFSLLLGSMFAWKSWSRVAFVGRNDLSTEDIAKVFVNLPENLQENQHILDAFGSMARISWLFATNEFSLVIDVVGSSIQNLLTEIYPKRIGENAGVSKMAKKLGIDVSYEKQGYRSDNSFSVTYFWHEVRSKYTHSRGLEKVGSKQVFVNVLKEPSEETAEMSIGLLNVFLKAYSEYCKKFGT